MRRVSWIAVVLFVVFVAGSSPTAHARSAMQLPLPETFGEVGAGTFDAAGHRIGEARISVVRRADGRVELTSQSGIEGSARSAVSAEMEFIADGAALRLVSQRSESFDQRGASLGVLSIDHEKRTARCSAPPGTDESDTTLELPEHDRVVNVPLNLLFQRLVTGESDEVAFQVLLCRFGVRLVDARARVATPAQPGSGLVEVRYRLDFGPILSSVAAPFLPTLSFWFDRTKPAVWVAHRMPLFSQGPTVLVVRSGFPPERLVPDVGAGGY